MARMEIDYSMDKLESVRFIRIVIAVSCFLFLSAQIVSTRKLTKLLPLSRVKPGERTKSAPFIIFGALPNYNATRLVPSRHLIVSKRERSGTSRARGELWEEAKDPSNLPMTPRAPQSTLVFNLLSSKKHVNSDWVESAVRLSFEVFLSVFITGNHQSLNHRL